jgi:Flp pilus assembly protein TadG
MKQMIKFTRRNDTKTDPFNSDSGVSLPLVAMMMVTLLGLAAFAIDLGWFYLNASRIQRAADASALAGVIHMPNDPSEASDVAHEIAEANGYLDLGIPDTYPTVVASGVVSEPTQLQVTVTDQVDTFFLKVFGMSTQVITRTAQAEFVPPLPLGSPANQFGNSCDPSGCPNQPNFWANIHGRFTNTISGDAFSSACKGSMGSPCEDASANPTFRDDADKRPGYLYGIEANGAPSFTVEFTDIAFHNTSGSLIPEPPEDPEEEEEPRCPGNVPGTVPVGCTTDHVRTGDRGCEEWGNFEPDCGPTVRVTLFQPDSTPLDVTDGTAICTQDIAPQPQVGVSDSYDWIRPSPCFTVNNPGGGIYVLNVRVLSTGSTPNGLNRYSVRSMPGTTRLYAIGDMSIYNNSSGSVTSFYLAEVSQIYAGKTFVVELYDAGDFGDTETGNLQVLAPGGSVFGGTCRIYSRTLVTDPWSQHPAPVACQEPVLPSEYNGRWLKFEMDLPTGYECTDCWWKMHYAFSGSTQDTTTWRAYILGNPIHLVPTS